MDFCCFKVILGFSWECIEVVFVRKMLRFFFFFLILILRMVVIGVV